MTGLLLQNLRHRTAKGLLLCGLLFMTGCGPSDNQMDFQKLPQGGWPLGTPVRFNISVQDSLRPHSVWLTLRHTNEYPFSSIYLITTLSHPNGSVITDTLSYDLAAPNGLWLGTGNALITQELLYKKNVRFHTSKAYTLSVYQSVRELGAQKGLSVLPAVTEVGYRLAPSE